MIFVMAMQEVNHRGVAQAFQPASHADWKVRATPMTPNP
jgi:hypothetical protein